MKNLMVSLATAAAVLVAPAVGFAQETITRIILSDRPVKAVLHPPGGNVMMTLDQLVEHNPQFKGATLETIVEAGTKITQPL